MKAWTGLFLVLGGLVHALPQLYEWLSGLTGGEPYVQIVVGIISVILGLWTWFAK